MSAKDHGSGFTIDDLINIPAWYIEQMRLPREKVFMSVHRSARLMVKKGLESYCLSEIWEDGHTVWNHENLNNPVVVVKPDGSINYKKR